MLVRRPPQRRRSGRLLAVMVATVLAVVGVIGAVGPTAQALVGPPAPRSVTAGSLDWGVKASFRSYITGPAAAGSITVGNGASTNTDGTFKFPATVGTPVATGATKTLSFDGSVHFLGHDGQLDVYVTGLRVEGTGTAGTLIADVTSKALDSSRATTYDDVRLAAVDLTGQEITFVSDQASAAAAPTTMTAGGAPAFAGFYPAGTALDPVSYSVTAPRQWTPSVTVAKTTGVDPAGETITVSGQGFDPTANVGTRPPLPGQPTGIYVVFGRFAATWKPSAGAPGSARQVIDQRWALPVASRQIVDPNQTNPQFVELDEEGNFSTTLAIAPDDTKTGDYAVVTYAAGGAVAYASQETFTPISFATSTPTTTTPSTTVPTSTTNPSSTTAPDSTTTTNPGSTTTLPGVTTTTAPAPPIPAPITGGFLDWGVKSAFVSYIRGPIANGTVDVLDGAAPSGAGFRFPATSGQIDASGNGLTATFGGRLHFSGHGGQLDLTMSGLRVVTAGSTGTLYADVTSTPLGSTAAQSYPGVALATLDLSGVSKRTSGDLAVWSGIEATLSSEGAPAFSGFYSAGTALDPVIVALASAGGTGTTTTTRPGTPTTVDPDAPAASVDRSTVSVGSTLLVTGDGFQAGEQVEVWLHSDPVFLVTAIADAQGRISETVTIPGGAALGLHRIELRGVSSSNSVFSEEFEVVAADDPAGTVPAGGTGSGTGSGSGVGSGTVSGSGGSGGSSSSGSGLARTGFGADDAARFGAVVLLAGLAVTAAARRRTA